MKRHGTISFVLASSLCCLIAIIALLPALGCSSNPAKNNGSGQEAREAEAFHHLETITEPTYEASPKPKPAPSEEGSGGALSVSDLVKATHAETAAVEKRIAEGDPTAKICYLTLDDGPSENTLDILRILEEKHVLVTWFIQGNSAQIDLLKNIADAGHGIGLHTFSHDYAQVYASESAYFADLAAVQDAVSSRIGHTVDIVRFPGGTSNGVSSKYCAGIMTRLTQSVPAAGYQYFDWNLSGGDSSSPPPPASDITANVMNNVGSMQRICVLAHDTTIKKTTVEALPAIIDGLRSQGYTFGVLTHDTPPFHHQPGN